jgi:hypothetical protein
MTKPTHDSVKGTGLPPDGAKEMNELLRQQALERIRQRGWSCAGMNKRKAVRKDKRGD